MKVRLFLALISFVGLLSAATVKPAIAPEYIALGHQLPKWAQGWSSLTGKQRAAIADDDIQRHANDPAYWDGIDISEKRFSENGFEWHLIRYSSRANPYGVIWFVPHDDENAAFEAMIAAIKLYGGMGIVVNSGAGSLRRQSGKGTCGGRPAYVSSCDPNRNFSASTPLFTSALLDHHTEDHHPIIALHTNGAGAAGDFSLLDIDAYARGRTILRTGAYRAKNPTPQMDNYDTLGLIAYPAHEGAPNSAAVACRNALNSAGIHFWHEEVEQSDGSLSNYLALKRPDLPYFNAESREEIDLTVSAARHAVMIAAYLEKCPMSGNKPAP